MNKYEGNLEHDATHWKNPTFFNNSKRAVFYARAAIYKTLFRAHFRLDENRKFYLPGFEMKLACESAERNNAELKFLGSEFNQNTINRLFHETRLNLYTYVMRCWQYMGYDNWQTEYNANLRKMYLVSASAYTEKCLDRYLVNWHIANMNIYFPHLKRVLIDKRAEDIFRSVD